MFEIEILQNKKDQKNSDSIDKSKIYKISEKLVCFGRNPAQGEGF